ncbi:MAG: sugar phosphate isomerase/epimerase [Oscillospiraceae bacterium]|nr:sugar phosphate isomerase/epimerase [Oscillospiraceae bacterium]
MKFAVYTCSMPEYSIEEAAALIKEMGYDAVEWRVDKTEGESPLKAMFANLPEAQKYAFRYWTDNHATLNVNDIMNECLRAKKVCDEVGIEIVNLATTLKGKPEEMENTIAAAAAIGCKTVRGPMATYDPNRPYWEQFNEYRAYLRECEPLLRKYGVKFLIETHHGMMISSASSALRVLDGFDPEYFGLIYDPGNMVYEGYEAYQLGFEMLGKYLAHVHVKNAALTPAGEDEFGATKYNQSWMPMKKGAANLNAMIKALVKVGYDGVLSVEDFSNEQPTKEKLVDALAYLKALVAAAQA